MAMPELTRRRPLDHVWVGSWFLATVFRRDRTSFGMRSTPRGRQCRMRRLYPAGLKRSKDEKYRHSSHRPSPHHGNPVPHRDIMTTSDSSSTIRIGELIWRLLLCSWLWFAEG